MTHTFHSDYLNSRVKNLEEANNTKVSASLVVFIIRSYALIPLGKATY